jgi:N-methylhydantoinase A/oxoprolinase/acetone carboxylase beta subunit
MALPAAQHWRTVVCPRSAQRFRKPVLPRTTRPTRRRAARPRKAAEYRFGFDIGGTFTDLVVSSSAGGIYVGKVLSRPDAITRSVVEGLAMLLDREGLPANRIHEVVSGATTVVTNLIIERKGAPTGLLTTAGFPDLIEIAREVRCDIYDLRMRLPDPIVPRAWRKEVIERIDRDGNVVVPLDEESVRSAVASLRRDGVKAIAVSLLHAYRYPAHEQRIREIVRAAAPEVFVTLSSDVLPEIREY